MHRIGNGASEMPSGKFIALLLGVKEAHKNTFQEVLFQKKKKKRARGRAPMHSERNLFERKMCWHHHPGSTLSGSIKSVGIFQVYVRDAYKMYEYYQVNHKVRFFISFISDCNGKT